MTAGIYTSDCLLLPDEAKVVESPCDSAAVPDGAPLSIYQCFQNVRNFLVAAGQLGLPTFEPSDLEQGGKSSKIVNCILELKSYSEWKQTGARADWWSVGVILFELLVGIPPFNAESPQRYTMASEMSFEAYDLINNLLTENPVQRLGSTGAVEVKTHHFFKNIHWDTLAREKTFVPSAETLDTSYFMSRYIWNPEDEHVDGGSDFDDMSDTDSTCGDSSFSNMLEEEGDECGNLAEFGSTVNVNYSFSNFSFKIMTIRGLLDDLNVPVVAAIITMTAAAMEQEKTAKFGNDFTGRDHRRWGNKEEVFTKLQTQLAEIMGDKYNIFMVEEPNSEGPDPRSGPRLSFGMLRKEVSEPGSTTLWQYINRLPPEVVKYFTDPDAIEPPDMQLLYPFVEAALPLVYDVLGVQLFHVRKIPFLELLETSFIRNGRFDVDSLQEVRHFPAAFPKKFKSILPDRKTKVDIYVASPFAGAALSLSMFGVGLLISSKPDMAGDMVRVSSVLFQGSLLFGLMLSLVLLSDDHALRFNNISQTVGVDNTFKRKFGKEEYMQRAREREVKEEWRMGLKCLRADTLTKLKKELTELEKDVFLHVYPS
ncbi:hypothetical protein L2E82_24339 [Cichorium intybus]|uniref:Uncharacterized protein n=1 Tax=Cichorium intybus TaxID=13427 RepID=A0ACB9E0D1_CICIN|nr:hypothetical protein L2E82_24339 [Cichorium intybus]